MEKTTSSKEDFFGHKGITQITYPENIRSGELPSWIQFLILRRENIKTLIPEVLINLYMPEETSQPNTVRWADENLGALGAGLQAYENNEGMVQSALKTLGIGVVGAGKGMIKSLLNRFGGDSDAVQKIIERGFGEMQNPYLTAVFDGINFRTFTFKFKFTPYSESDCDTIDRIIKEFRKAALPAKGSTYMTFKYPKEILIRYSLEDGKLNKWLQKFKNSVIEYIDVGYGMGDGWTTYRNGFPIFIQLTMRFKEIKLVLREDVDDGY